ncbi:MAG: hypothetical protein ACJAVM_000416 [Sulfitobacter sp.]
MAQTEAKPKVASLLGLTSARTEKNTAKTTTVRNRPVADAFALFAGFCVLNLIPCVACPPRLTDKRVNQRLTNANLHLKVEYDQ